MAQEPRTLDGLHPPSSPQVPGETTVITSVLLVMSPDRRLSLLECLENCGLAVLLVEGCREAARILESDPSVKILLTDAVLPDGSWTDLAAQAARRDRRAEVIICMRISDPKLWIDALERGVYDVLVEPYHRNEVRRIVKAAAVRNDNQPRAARVRRLESEESVAAA